MGAAIDERVYPPVAGWDGDDTEANPSYPEYGCRGGAFCDVCPRWRCKRCRRLRPWCFGAAGAHGGWCDDCFAKHLRRKRCRTCGEARRPRSAWRSRRMKRPGRRLRQERR